MYIWEVYYIYYKIFLNVYLYSLALSSYWLPEFTASQPLLWDLNIWVHCTLLSSGLSSVVRAQLFGSHIQRPPCVSVCEFPNVEMVMVWTRFSLALQLIQMQSSFAEHLNLSKLHPMLSRVLIFGILAFCFHPILMPFLACDCYHWIGMRPYGCQVGLPPLCCYCTDHCQLSWARSLSKVDCFCAL